MKIFFTIIGFFFFIQTASSQVKPVSNNKANLAYLDSLLNIIKKKKNELAVLLSDFLQESQNLEKSGDRNIKGKTIDDRLRAVETNSKARNKTAPVSPSLVTLERVASKIKNTEAQIDEEKKKWQDKKDSMSELNEKDMLMLQQMMDKKNQLEMMISNTMQASYEVAQAAVQALKGS